MLGTYALSAGYYDAYYGKAQKVRTLIIRDFERAFERFDVLLSPTSPTTAFRIGEKTDDPLAMYLNDIFTIPANLAGVPAISVPCGAGRRAGCRSACSCIAPALDEARCCCAPPTRWKRVRPGIGRPPAREAERSRASTDRLREP